MQNLESLERWECPPPYPDTTQVSLFYHPPSGPRNANIILAQDDDGEQPVVFTYRIPHGKKLAVYVRGVKVDEAAGGGVLAVRGDANAVDTIVSFEGFTAGDFEWAWYFAS